MSKGCCRHPIPPAPHLCRAPHPSAKQSKLLSSRDGARCVLRRPRGHLRQPRCPRPSENAQLNQLRRQRGHEPTSFVLGEAFGVSGEPKFNLTPSPRDRSGEAIMDLLFGKSSRRGTTTIEDLHPAAGRLCLIQARVGRSCRELVCCKLTALLHK